MAEPEVKQQQTGPRESSSTATATDTLTRNSTNALSQADQQAKQPKIDGEQGSSRHGQDNGAGEMKQEQPGQPSQAAPEGTPALPVPTEPATLLTGEPQSEAPAIEEPPIAPKHSIHSTWAKRLIIFAASISAFFSPLTAQIYLPALPTLADEFNVTATKVNLTVTTYMIFQGITPMFLGGLADSAGRRPAYVICFVIYIAANIGLALSKNLTSLLVLRMLQSAGSSTTVALCQATLADITTSAERGHYIGITSIPTVLAPSLGPVLGGVLTNYLGWRWIFWLLTIMASVNLLAMIMFFPETCRKIVGDGSGRKDSHWIYWTGWQLLRDKLASRQRRRQRARREVEAISKEDPANGTLHRTVSIASAPRQKIKLRLAPPNLLESLTLLFRDKELAILLCYSAIVFSGFYAIGTAMPNQLQTLYGLNDVQIGLMYLPMAGGSIVTAFAIGRVITWNYHRHARRLDIVVDRTRQADLTYFPIERARLEVGLPLLALTSAVIISWGWAMQWKSSLAAPCVLLFLLGIGMIGFNNSVNTLIADIYPGKAGAATAANNLTRCLLGAASSAVILPMVDGIGSGWAYTMFGVLYVGFSPLLAVLMRRGMRWRVEEKWREDAKKERKRQEQMERHCTCT
ncbi:major facilitator superfamily domain-containing protein [Copromyces sp. CBS 386.78]|nr:major facilitator superfamily domain-containing protein [Copromyces sp. CBS 386.78]